MKKKRSRKLPAPTNPTKAPPSGFSLAANLVQEAMVRLDEGLAKNGPVQLHSGAHFLKRTLASCEEELRILDTVAPIFRMATTPLEQATLQPYYDAAFGVATSSVVDSTGMHFTFACDRCGIRLTVVVPWGELIRIASGQVPPGWIYSHRRGTLHPKVQCHHCGNEKIMTMGIDEAAQYVRAGVRAGYVVVDGQKSSRKRHNARTRPLRRRKGGR